MGFSFEQHGLCREMIRLGGQNRQPGNWNPHTGDDIWWTVPFEERATWKGGGIIDQELGSSALCSFFPSHPTHAHARQLQKTNLVSFESATQLKCCRSDSSELANPSSGFAANSQTRASLDGQSIVAPDEGTRRIFERGRGAVATAASLLLRRHLEQSEPMELN